MARADSSQGAGCSAQSGSHYDWLAWAFPAARGADAAAQAALFRYAFLGGPPPPAAARRAAVRAPIRSASSGREVGNVASLMFPAVSPAAPFWGPPGGAAAGERPAWQSARPPRADAAGGGGAPLAFRPGAVRAAPRPARAAVTYSRGELQALRGATLAGCVLMSSLRDDHTARRPRSLFSVGQLG